MTSILSQHIMILLRTNYEYSLITDLDESFEQLQELESAGAMLCCQLHNALDVLVVNTQTVVLVPSEHLHVHEHVQTLDRRTNIAYGVQ